VSSRPAWADLPRWLRLPILAKRRLTVRIKALEILLKITRLLPLIGGSLMRKFTIAWLVLLALSACGKSPGPDEDPSLPGRLQTIRFAVTFQPQSALIHIAEAKGYFKSEGLDVQYQRFEFGKPALQTVLDGKADLAVAAETPIMFAVLKGEKIFIVANIEASNTNHGVVARKGPGISTLADLKGQRIGFSKGTTSDFFLDSLLNANGLTRQDIHPVDMRPDEMLAAIKEGRVDAVCTWNYPLTQIKQELGAKGLVFLDPQVFTETFNLVGQQDFVKKNPQAIERLLRAVIRAEGFVITEPLAAQAIVAKATGHDVKLVREVWDNFNYRVQLDDVVLITLEDETRWAIKNLLTDRTVMPNYRNYIYRDGLKAVAPRAVRLKD
jgi:NitT/TauT family transport system substrate-binding protein